MLEKGIRTQRGPQVKGPPSSRIRDLSIIFILAQHIGKCK